MDRELENQNEEEDDFVASPANSQSADEENYEEIEDAEGTFPPSQIDEQDDWDGEFPMESLTQFHSGGDGMIEEGENHVEETTTTTEARVDEEEENVVVEAPSKVVRTPKLLRGKAKVVKKSPAGNSVKKSSEVGTSEMVVEPINSGGDQVIDEGEKLAVEETNKSQTEEEKSEEAEVLVGSSDKAKPRKRIVTKTRLVRSKAATKSSAGNSAKKSSAIGTAEIAVEPSTELNSDDGKMIDNGENLVEETAVPQTDEQKNGEAEGVLEGSDKADTSKRTSNSLQARPKIAKKTSAVKKKSATGNKQVKVKIIKKKVLQAVNKESAQSENGVVMGLNAAENVQNKDIVADMEPSEKDQVKAPENELIIGELSKSQEAQKDNGIQTGTPRRRVRNRKNKRKIDGEAASQSVDKKKKLDTNDEANGDEDRGGNVLGVEDKQPKDEKRKGKNIAKDNKSNRDEKKKEDIDGKGKKSAQDLKNERLGGLIFMCSGKTRPDVFNYGVMGETIGKKELVQSIKPGLKLFLYDFERRVMHGIYEASTSGGMKLEPKAFSGSFPAQVRFRIYKECNPIPESTFKKAIKENYNNRNKFDIKLTVRQVRKLITLFQPAAFSQLQSKAPPARPAPPAARDRVPRSARRDRSERDAFPKPRDRPHRRDPGTKLKDNRSRQHPPARGHERDLPIRSRELLPPPLQRRDGPPPRERDLYMSEREYRAYGLQSDRRNLSPLPPPRRSLDRERERERERYVRQVEPPIYRDPLPAEPLYYTRHQQVPEPYIPSARGGELHYGPSSSIAATASLPTSGLDSYARDSYYAGAYSYGTGAPPSSYLPSLRREVGPGSYPVSGSGYSSYVPVGREPDRVDPLRSGYTTTLDRLPHYNDPRYYSEANAEAAAAPVSSRYSFSGPSLSYSYR